LHELSEFRRADELWSSLACARANNCNLLANVGPKPDGSIPEDKDERIEAQIFVNLPDQRPPRREVLKKKCGADL